ncbi:cell-cycle control medial ring component [Chaetomium fimeti]|uniref:Cell-cycle control medial ring component n=1 Tax=Chaetomium fimeti TaxID=1854472 RepID=A0AAE0LQL7_9PEZI|nr:cell-cycle control medial ring component [Chaetomium fimeti]
MATEILFAKTFLSLLDGRPPKISPDHIEDPRTYPSHSPYTLPRHASQKPFSKPPPATTTTPSDQPSSTTTTGTTTTKQNPGAAPATSVTLRSARNPPFELTLPAVALTTSLAEIKERVVAETGIPLDKIKLLVGKKPVGDSKVLKELVSSSSSSGGVGGVELGVMVLGGGAAFFKGVGGAVGGKKVDGAAAAGAGSGAGEVGGEGEAAVAAPVAQGLSGEGVLKTEAFWEDLKGYLQQRVRDEGVAGDALGVFRGAWEGRS